MSLSEIEKIVRVNNFLLIPHIFHTNIKIKNSEYFSLYESVKKSYSISESVRYFFEILYNMISITVYGLIE